MSIGKNIAYFRKKKGFTQSELGELLGVSNQAISKWESEMTMPDVMLLPQIAKVLEVTLIDLYEDTFPDEALETNPKTISSTVENGHIENRRILAIRVQADGANVTTKMPVSAIKSVLGNQLLQQYLGDCEDNQLEALLAMLDQNMTGTLVNAVTEEGSVTISVEEYQN